MNPAIAVDSAGRWTIVWASSEPAYGGNGAAIGGDFDIVYTESCNLDAASQGAILGHLLGNPAPNPAALDCNCDGVVDIADAIYRAPIALAAPPPSANPIRLKSEEAFSGLDPLRIQLPKNPAFADGTRLMLDQVLPPDHRPPTTND